MAAVRAPESGAPPPLTLADPGAVLRTARAAGIADPDQFMRGWRDWRRGLTQLAPTSYFEKSIGRDDSLPYQFLAKGARLGAAVCKIECSGIDHRGIPGSPWCGSGFLVGPDLLLTNHHVINSPEVARTALAIFGYERDYTGKWSPRESYQLDPDRLFLTSAAIGGLDYTFVHINGRPQDRYGWIPMERAAFIIAENERANIVHHPQGNPKRVSLQDNKILNFDALMLHYTSDTEYGSSGSPVFDNSWRLIAMHHAFSPLPAGMTSPEGSLSGFINEGIKISAIAVDLETRLKDSGERTAAGEILACIKGADSLGGYFGALGRSVSGKTALERVVNAYRGTAKDIDVGFWNVEWFNRRHHDRASDVARVVADLNLDVWALSETSPEATAALVAALQDQFGQKFDYLASEPDAPPGRQTTAIIWNPLTVDCRRMDWPEAIDRVFRADSRAIGDSSFEAVEGKIFDRYPALFRVIARNRRETELPAFDFNLVPLHLKAKAEGAKRRRLASKALSWAVGKMIAEHGAAADWLLGGDINAELASGDFASLTGAGFVAMSAEDEAEGAFSYLKRPNSLIDSIFLSPSVTRTYGASDFIIYARDETSPDYARQVSDHRPVMARLSLADRESTRAPSAVSPELSSVTPAEQAPADAAVARALRQLIQEDPEILLRSMRALLSGGD